MILLSIACCIVDMFPKRTKVEKTFDMFPGTGKGSRYVPDYEQGVSVC